MSNLYRGHSIDASYQVSVHLAKRFQRRFKKIGQSETKIACGSHVTWLTVSASKLNLSQISFSSLGAAIFNSNIRIAKA
jgi:hypothetical protein